MALISVYFALLATAGQDPRQAVPPPPPSHLEIFGPTLRDHKVHATCGAGSVRIAWQYDGKSEARITGVSVDGERASDALLAQMNQLADEIPQDFFVWIECAHSNAIIAFVEAGAAGSRAGAKQVKFDLVNGAIRGIRRYNFARE